MTMISPDMESAPPDSLAAFARQLETDPNMRPFRALHDAHPLAEVYVVGGIVRDVLLGRPAKDLDLVVRGVPANDLHAFLAAHGSVNLVGRTFGVLKFRPEGLLEDAEDIDVALPRTEHAEGTGGYRDVEVQSDPALPITADLARRDFTMNAMAWDVRLGMLVDPFDGRRDLERRVIRTVGEPHERFAEDRSRILRALRLATQLGFAIDPKTMDEIRARMTTINEQRPVTKVHAQLTLLHDVEFVTPREVVARELIKSFVADPVRSFDLWEESGAIEHLIPELLAMKGCAQPGEYHAEGDVWTHTRLALSMLQSDAYRAEFGNALPSALVTFGVLLHDIGKPPTQRTPERDGTNRIRFDGHDEVGGRMARAIARRLALASPFPNGHALHVNLEDLGWIIDHHLLLLNDPATMRNATIERYFFHPNVPGEAYLRVTFCDGSAALPAGAKVADLAHFAALRARLRQLATFVEERDRLPAPILDGHDIMAQCNIPPGPAVGALIEALREEQLTRLQRGEVMTREDAEAFLKMRGTHR